MSRRRNRGVLSEEFKYELAKDLGFFMKLFNAKDGEAFVPRTRGIW